MFGSMGYIGCVIIEVGEGEGEGEYDPGGEGEGEYDPGEYDPDGEYVPDPGEGEGEYDGET